MHGQNNIKFVSEYLDVFPPESRPQFSLLLHSILALANDVEVKERICSIGPVACTIRGCTFFSPL